jgi:hypothetical protein
MGLKNTRGLGDLLKEIYQLDLRHENPSQFGLGDWIELVRAQQRSGRLTIRQGQETFWIHFERGAMTSFQTAQREEDQLLGSLLVGSGRITGEQKITALLVQREGHRRLGEVLAGLGYVKPADLHDALQSQLKDCLHRVVTLQSPEYEFRESAEAPRPTFGRPAAGAESNGGSNGISSRFIDYVRQPFLSGQVPTYLSDTDHDNLKVLTAGSVPYELADAAFPVLIDRLSRSFDIVLLDCPPVAMTSPTNVLSECADGVLMVVKAEGYEVRIIQQARDQLLKAGANILGVILNQVNVGQDKALSYYYGAYRL